jgi:precorrin-6A/cobalt-precorrin-6A reductase
VRILVLGGTGEARALASRLVDAEVAVLSSLAGRVREPRLPAGPVRIGGFGGAAGLAAFLREGGEGVVAGDRRGGFTAVVDATHPFATTITANAVDATATAGVPLLVLRRPGWPPDPAWRTVPDMAAAAAAVRDWTGESVFLTTGRRDLPVFAGDDRHRFLVRTVDPPEGAVPPRMTLLLDRGPYTVDGERALLREHGVGLLVTKDSGGTMTAAKLHAARELDVPVVVVRRPPLPAGCQLVETVDDALAWLAETDQPDQPR